MFPSQRLVIIDMKSSFADWLNNQIVHDQLKFDIKVCLIMNGYPLQYSPKVFGKVMEQVEAFEADNRFIYSLRSLKTSKGFSSESRYIQIQDT